MRMRAGGCALLLGTVVLVLQGCSRERIDWKSAEAADTIQAYNRFLERHPDSELAPQARARMAQLTEDRDWQRAVAANTVAAYEQFLSRHAAGKWAEEARIRIESFALEGNPSPLSLKDAALDVTPAPTSVKASTLAQPGERAAASPVVQPASPPPGPPAAAQAASVGQSAPASAASGFGIQLGAFSTQAAALGEWKRLQASFARELGGLTGNTVRVQTNAGTLYRLQSPVGDEARARGICAALVRQKQPCVVVLPKS
jgi:cell division septation protein DedD